MKFLINLMKKIVLKYEFKHPYYESPAFTCDRIKTRDYNRNAKHKIPLDEHQCPVYHDNRCCGACKFAATCDYCVDCNCFGYAYAQRGGTPESVYMRKGGNYYDTGRIKDGKFDWDYHYDSLKRKEILPGKFMFINGEIYCIKTKVNFTGDFTAFQYGTETNEGFNTKNLKELINVFDTVDILLLRKEIWANN